MPAVAAEEGGLATSEQAVPVLSNAAAAAAAAGDLHWMAEHTSEDLGLPKERERESISCAIKNFSSVFLLTF